MNPIITREVTPLHHDGHGLNDIIHIWSDELDPNAGGAAHRYEATSSDGLPMVHIQFQHGPRNVEGSVSGATEAVILTILIDRIRSFQAGPYSCRENAIQLTKLEEVLHWTRARADERARRGVLGKNEK